MFANNLCNVPVAEPVVDELGHTLQPICGYDKDSQFYSQDFNRAENGFARSDISAYIHAESDELKTVIAQRLNEIKDSYPDQNLSDEQLIQLCIPRNVQSYHDMRSWYASIKDEGFEKAVKAVYEKANPQPVSEPVSDPVKSVVVDPE